MKESGEPWSGEAREAVLPGEIGLAGQVAEVRAVAVLHAPVPVAVSAVGPAAACGDTALRGEEGTARQDRVTGRALLSLAAFHRGPDPNPTEGGRWARSRPTVCQPRAHPGLGVLVPAWGLDTEPLFQDHCQFPHDKDREIAGPGLSDSLGQEALWCLQGASRRPCVPLGARRSSTSSVLARGEGPGV